MHFAVLLITVGSPQKSPCNIFQVGVYPITPTNSQRSVKRSVYSGMYYYRAFVSCVTGLNEFMDVIREDMRTATASKCITWMFF